MLGDTCQTRDIHKQWIRIWEKNDGIDSVHSTASVSYVDNSIDIQSLSCTPKAVPNGDQWIGEQCFLEGSYTLR